MTRMRWVPAAASALLLAAAGVVFAVPKGSADVSPGPVIYACIKTGGTGTSQRTLYNVRLDNPGTCQGSNPVISWQGLPSGSPSPSPTPTSPSPTPTTPSPTPTTPSPSATATSPAPSGSCTGTASSGDVVCGGYNDPQIYNSNGFNTYDETNCWGHPGCGYQITAPDPSGSSVTPWTVTATEPAGNTAVESYPNTQQLTDDVAISSLTSLTSSYSESMPHNGGTIAQAAYDIWTDYSSDIMVWLDNVNRGSGGADQIGSLVVGGQSFTAYRYGGTGGEIIFSLDGPGGAGTFAQQSSGSVDLLPFLQWVKANVDPGLSKLGQVDFGWEICSTGSSPESFTLNSYTLTAS